MEHYVTLFDKAYLPQGLALYNSMKLKVSSFSLWVVCMDDETYHLLNNLNFKYLKCLRFSEYETKQLKEVKEERSKVEYYWTVTPFVADFVFQADQKIKRVTYIDADLWFLKDPQLIFDNFINSSKSVMITNHGFLKEYDTSKEHGKYCVQFIIFDKEKSAHIRKSWQNNCLEWCYARSENGKFGDQKYLDEWPVLFSNEIYILENFEYSQAPWNSLKFDSKDAIFFHFHGLKIISLNSVLVGSYYLKEEAIENFYSPYLNDIRQSIDTISQFKNNSIILQGRKPNLLKEIILKFYIALIVKRLKPARLILKW